MNVKELILSHPVADIAAALIDRLDVEPAKRDKGIRRITALIDSLRGMEPETTDYMLLGVYHMYDDKEFLDANLYCKSELPAELAPLPGIITAKGIDELTVDETEQAARAIQLPQGYAFELSPWREVLGYEVNIANAREVGVAAFCAAVLYEMTFFGFDEKAVDAERQKLYDSLHEAEELDKLPPEERAKQFCYTRGCRLDYDAEVCHGCSHLPSGAGAESPRHPVEPANDVQLDPPCGGRSLKAGV